MPNAQWTQGAGLLVVSLLVLSGAAVSAARPIDWLRARNPGLLHPASATVSPGGDLLKLSNGLVSRTFALTPNWATVDLSLEQGDQGAGQSFLRGLSPEAKLFLQGIQAPVDIGGLVGEQRYLLWYPQTVNLTADPEAFRYVGHELTKPEARFPWRPQRNSDNASWPPKGVHLAVHFEPPGGSKNGTNSSSLTERDNFEIPCEPDQSGVIKCLTGHAKCDNTTVAQQCTLPWATAQAVCESWPECRALSCVRGKSCQARAHTKGQPSAGTVAFVKGAPPFPYPDLRVTVHYEVYDGLPTIAKWVDVQNIATADQHPRSATAFSAELPAEPMLAQLTVERVHVPWHLRQRYHCETDFMPQIGVRNSFEDAGWYPASGHYSANFTGLTNPPGNLWRYDTELMGPWGKDDSLHYWYDMGMNETLLEVQYPFGPGTVIAPNSTLSSFRTYTILQDTDDLERQSLQRRKMVRTLAPQVTENMLMFYCNTGDSATIRRCADQAAETGFEMLHTHVNPTNLDPVYLAQVKADHDYIHAKGMLTGTYVLLQNPPGLNASTEIIDPETGQPEGIACFATSFHQQFLNTIEKFIQATGIDFMDTDGPFEQAPCGSTHHSGHHGLLDSQWAQYSENVAWYQKLKGLDCGSCRCPSCGLYLGVPDPYYFQGGINTEPIGFTDAWGRTADNDEFLTYGRVYQHDGLYWKPPGLGSIGFDTQRAGAQQSKEELRFLETGLVQFFGIAGWGLDSSANVIYKTQAAKALLTKWVSWNKKHRRILNADILHVRRPSGRSWDCIGHADAAPPRPGIDPRGLFLFFNPTAQNISAVFSLPLYYTGAERLANVSVSYMQGGGSVLPIGASPSTQSATATVDLDYEIEVGLDIQAKGYAIATIV